MKYLPVSKRRVYIFLSVCVGISTILTFVLLPYLFDYESTDRDFNTFLNKHDMQNNKIVLNAIGTETLGITSASAIVSRHAYSYKEGGDNLALPWYVDLLIGPMIQEVSQAQYDNLNNQIQNGVVEFDIRISKLNDGSHVVDHGIVYGTVKEFMTDLENCDLGSNNIKVHYRASGYSPQRISNVDMENELRKHHTNNQIQLLYADYRDWEIKDSDDFMDLLTILQSDKEYKVLTVYRSAGDIIRIGATVFASSFIVLLLFGWIVFVVVANTKKESDV